MDERLAEWLALRETADVRARSRELAYAVVNALPAEVSVLDLGTGTGSNLRYLAGLLPARQQWLLVDRSPDLLALVGRRTASWAAEGGYAIEHETGGFTIRGARLECHVRTRQLDLNHLDNPALFDGRHLVTASALLDLVSAGWLRLLAHHCRAAGAHALFSLTYDGRSACTPAEPDDELVRGLMNAHQHRDKGLGGPAAGPDAVACAMEAFAGAGYEVRTAQSDWVIAPADVAFQRQLIDGWAEAGTEQDAALAPRIAGWRSRRLAHVEAGNSHIVVGHHDLAAWPRPD